MWKDKIFDLVKEFKHPAWGISHFTRVYKLSLELVKVDQLRIDYDALYAAAYLHDIGAFKPYSQKEKDHSDVAIENCDDILGSTDFPQDKFQLVKDIIKSHMFYATPVNNLESKIFHDADTLDFMGTIGVTRILSIVGKEDWTSDLSSAIKLIKKFSTELPSSLVTNVAQKIGEVRKKEMEEFLKNLAEETNQYEFL